MLNDPVFWILAVIGIALTGISKSGFAGGAGVVAIPLLSFKLSVLEATALVLPILLLMDIQTVRYYWRSVNMPILKKIIPGALLGIGIGGLLLSRIPNDGLLWVLAILSVGFALWGSLQNQLTRFRGAASFWSCFSGLSSTLVHSGGPPINIYLLSCKLDKLTWLATAGCFFATMNLVKLIPYTLNEQWNSEILLASLLLLPAGWVGVYLGRTIQGYIRESDFALACRILLFLSGLGLIYKAIV